MKFLKKFETTAQYNAYTADTANFIKPNVSLIKETSGVAYHKYDFYDRYFTFVAREQGTFTLTIGSAVTTSVLQSISYSTDDGETWTTTNNVNSQTVTITTPTINQGGKVLWKGTGVGVSTATSAYAPEKMPPTSSMFSSTCDFDVEGSIMSLIYGDDFADKDSVSNGTTHNFCALFCSNTHIVSAKKMCLPIKSLTTGCYLNMFRECSKLTTIPNELPATTLASDGYCYMFQSCTSLTSIPSGLLPATTLASDCYYGMFQSCTSLTSIPSGLLPATTLAIRCYFGMFSSCTSLTSIPSGLLPATTLAIRCYVNMFEGCTSITSIPSDLLPTTTLATKCYVSMFEGCTSITSIPSDLLPATTLATECYQSMFQGCTSLASIPSDLLPATTLAKSCYESMFDTCTSLTTVPELPATTLADRCYQMMFYNTNITVAPNLPTTTLTTECYQKMFSGCTNLNSITMLATDISASKCLDNWVGSVASSGTFKKAASMTTLPSGASGIPANWTVVNA